MTYTHGMAVPYDDNRPHFTGRRDSEPLAPPANPHNAPAFLERMRQRKAATAATREVWSEAFRCRLNKWIHAQRNRGITLCRRAGLNDYALRDIRQGKRAPPIGLQVRLELLMPLLEAEEAEALEARISTKLTRVRP